MEKTYYKNGNLKETVKKAGDQTTVTRYINNFPSKELLYKGDRLSMFGVSSFKYIFPKWFILNCFSCCSNVSRC